MNDTNKSISDDKVKDVLKNLIPGSQPLSIIK